MHAQGLGSVGSQLDISGNTALPGLPGCFGALSTIVGDLFLSNNGFLNLDGAFPVRHSPLQKPHEDVFSQQSPRYEEKNQTSDEHIFDM